VLCGGVAACFSGSVLIVASTFEQGAHASGWVVAVRGACALLFALGCVTAEALWRVRPWAYRASLALAASYLLVMLAFGVGGSLGDTLVLLGLSAFVVGLMLTCIRARSRQMWPGAGARVRAPRP
jgi:drug/metabolite transporter (DMT)-like permease